MTGRKSGWRFISEQTGFFNGLGFRRGYVMGYSESPGRGVPIKPHSQLRKRTGFSVERYLDVVRLSLWIKEQHYA